MSNNTKNEKPSTNTGGSKIVEIPSVRELDRAKNGHVATNPPPRPTKIPKK